MVMPALGVVVAAAAAAGRRGVVVASWALVAAGGVICGGRGGGRSARTRERLQGEWEGEVAHAIRVEAGRREGSWLGLKHLFVPWRNCACLNFASSSYFFPPSFFSIFLVGFPFSSALPYERKGGLLGV